ncbi:hypothetical protein B0H63DRAFT_509545 [Podospora didyma]|uniref:Secreted protein n=1 Tax=Podospora didyma TaxID=330526 RepID=A0AAE0U1W2_9PEZI|nr:hypothetical protein B0H63DRAFT_509545 [Podospora didyma]
MFPKFATVAAVVLAVLPSTFAAPAAEPVSAVENIFKRDGEDCASPRYMALGQVEFHNRAAIVAVLKYSYDRQTWNKVGGVQGPQVYSGGNYEYDRDAELRNIIRDTDFWLEVCDFAFNGCWPVGTQETNFRIPSSGSEWVASITFDVESHLSTGKAKCIVDRQMQDAWYP